MHASRLALAAALVAAPVLSAQTSRTAQTAQNGPTIAQFLSPASPLSLVAAKKADRIAWTVYERGMRNVYSAAAPAFTPVRLTPFLEDDGIDISDLTISNDGSIVVFTRGADPNRAGWVANPNHDPSGADRAIWAVRTAGGAPWRIVAGGDPVLSPDGSRVLYVRDGQIYGARTARGALSDSTQRGQKPLIKAWGRQSSPQWSPDGTKIAFVSDRENHAFIGVYDVRGRAVTYVSPSVDCDGGPAWSADSKQIAFVRRPGIPFGRQAQQGTGSGVTGPPVPGVARGGGAVMGCGGGGFGGGGGQNQPADTGTRRLRSPGFFDATLPGGSRLALMIADVSTCTRLSDGCKAREIFKAAPRDSVFAGIRSLMWAGENLLFPLSPQSDEWDRYYAISTTKSDAQPFLLTTTDGLIENASSVALSRDAKTLYYSTNANDIERRHIWAVPTAGGPPVQVSTQAIEVQPRPLSNRIAVVQFDVAHPGAVAILPTTGGGSSRIIFPTLPKDFPTEAHVKPEMVIVRSPDGVESHNQLFLPKDLKPGERRPAMVFVHGGPARQMLPGYHYMHFYNWSYGYNQWLASQGYVVLSVNYRLGIGYGRKFRQAPNTNARGNAEYLDVVAGAKYLQSRADVDPTRIGIWGLSYGGLLTAQALARNSDIFVAGGDLAGVHLYGNTLDTAVTTFRSSAVGAIDGWKSPVFLVHGDDDRNVDFAQTVGLVFLLRARNIYHELMVVPDDVHESMLHENWIITFNRMTDFFHRFVRDKENPAGAQMRTGSH